MVKMNNPFSVITPENITSDEIKNMFVENVDFSNLEKNGHTFIHGHRGCGKSMSLQVLRTKHYMAYRNIQSIKEVPFICMYIPIKKSVLANIELDRLKNDILEKYFSEHMLSLHFAINICKDLVELLKEEKIDINITEIKVFLKKLELIGFDIGDIGKNEKIIENVLMLFEDQWSKDNIVRRKISLVRNPDDIVEPEVFTTYHDFLQPLIKLIRNLDVTGKFKKNIYLLVDDADNLPLIFTKTLNEWILYRDTDNFSLKISTQLKYKTYRTISNNRIEKPHDYSEIIFSYVVSSAKKKEYKNLIKQIVEKRLAIIDIDINVEDFLEEKGEQKEKIELIKQDYIEKWEKGEGRGHGKYDDANRYARPDYIKSLGGNSKQKSNYSYSGFAQLVHISSGIVRHFLEPVSKMYEEQKNKTPNVSCIDPSIQNSVIRNESDEFFTKQFEDIEKEVAVGENKLYDEKIKKLKNFITALGENFHDILLSDLSERRVFSFSITDDYKVDEEIKSVLQLGIEYGLLYESKIGRKNSSGRTELYILTRLLAPHFTLDPNGFSGYQTLTTKWIREAFKNPNYKFKKLQQENNLSLEHIQPTLPGL